MAVAGTMAAQAPRPVSKIVAGKSGKRASAKGSYPRTITFKKPLSKRSSRRGV